MTAPQVAQQLSPEVALCCCSPKARLCVGQEAAPAPPHLLPQRAADVKILPLPSEMQGGPCTASASPQARLLFQSTILENLPPPPSLPTRNPGFSCAAVAPWPSKVSPPTVHFSACAAPPALGIPQPQHAAKQQGCSCCQPGIKPSAQHSQGLFPQLGLHNTHHSPVTHIYIYIHSYEYICIYVIYIMMIHCFHSTVEV